MIILKILFVWLVPIAAFLGYGAEGGHEYGYWNCLKDTWKQWWE